MYRTVEHRSGRQGSRKGPSRKGGRTNGRADFVALRKTRSVSRQEADTTLAHGVRHGVRMQNKRKRPEADTQLRLHRHNLPLSQRK